MAATTALAPHRYQRQRQQRQLPVLYGAMSPRWHNNGVRPGYIAMGALWTVQRMSWFRWDGSSAYGSGKEVAADFQRAYRWWVRITLTDVKRHDGPSVLLQDEDGRQ
jgi:hypothetical protein